MNACATLLLRPVLSFYCAEHSQRRHRIICQLLQRLTLTCMHERRRQAWWTTRINKIVLHYQRYSDEIFEYYVSASVLLSGYRNLSRPGKRVKLTLWVRYFIMQSLKILGGVQIFFFLSFALSWNHYIHMVSRSSSVGTATRYGLDSPRIESQRK